MQRIGVFVCHCGTNIAGTVDVKRVVEAVRKEPGVVYAEDYQYMCSEAGQQKIADAVKSEHLTGIVICSCSPRMHEGTFRKAAEKAGLNPYLVEIANIREQCSWIHKDVEEGTEKAVILARAAIAKVMLNAPLQPGESREVEFVLDRTSLSYFDDAKHAWVAEPGRFEVLIGASAEDIRSRAGFELK